jgi:NADPH:quinone reductase-like Zn-dependent oxidoreductase
LFFEDAPAPEVRAGDVLVRVFATGITLAELTWDETHQQADGTPRIPGIPRHEVSGVVERVVPDADNFRPGYEVYGLADFRATEQRLNSWRCEPSTWRGNR